MKLQTKLSYFQQDISRKEYVAAAARIVAVTGIIAYLCYESVCAVLLFIPIGILEFREWEKECAKGKREEFCLQFKDAIQAIASALSAGYSSENAIREAQKDLLVLYGRQMRIQKEFQYMTGQLRMNVPIEQILDEWAARTEQEDVQNFASVFYTAKKSGGNLIGIIRSAVRQISEKMEVKREIQTVMSAKRLEFRIMCAVPFAIIGYMKLSFPEFMNQLYGSLAGRGVMTVCLCIYAGAYSLGKRIINIEI